MSPVYIRNVSNLDRGVAEIDGGVGETGDVSSRVSSLIIHHTTTPKLPTNNKYCIILLNNSRRVESNSKSSLIKEIWRYTEIFWRIERAKA